MAKFGQAAYLDRPIPSQFHVKIYNNINTFIYATTTTNLGVPYPKVNKPDLNEIYKENKPNYAILKHHFQQEGRLSDRAATQIIVDVTQLLKQEENLLEIETPVNSLVFKYIFLFKK